MSIENPSSLEKTLFDFAPDAILLVDAAGRILRVNPQAESLFGYSADELQGRPIELLIPERFHQKHVLLRDGYNKAPRTRPMGAGQELWARHKSGREIAVEIALGRRRLQRAPWIVCVVRDITERHAAKEALRAAHDHLERQIAVRTEELSIANDALARSNQELRDFLHVASHDLQEPLRKIQTFGGRLEVLSTGALNDAAKDDLSRMQRAATRMQRLIHDLLAFSRVTTMAVSFELVSLDRLLSDVLADLQARIAACQATLEIERPLPSVNGDPLQLRQLLHCLVDNALKFRDPSRAHVVRVTGRERDDTAGMRCCELEIADNGIGFEPRFAERIFGLFQRLHGRDVYEGTGAGLAICRKIVERHRGTLTASGSPGAGATFAVVLPVRAA